MHEMGELEGELQALEAQHAAEVKAYLHLERVRHAERRLRVKETKAELREKRLRLLSGKRGESRGPGPFVLASSFFIGLPIGFWLVTLPLHPRPGIGLVGGTLIAVTSFIAGRKSLRAFLEGIDDD